MAQDLQDHAHIWDWSEGWLAGMQLGTGPTHSQLGWGSNEAMQSWAWVILVVTTVPVS